MGVLVTIALLGLYIEFQTPGVWLPGLVAVLCFVLIVGSKFLTGMANWVDVVIFVTGVLLILVEVFVIPGFGFVGVIGIIFVLAGLFGMLIKTPPGQIPWPRSDYDLKMFTDQVWAIGLGFLAFLVLAVLFSKYLPKIPIAKKLILASPVETDAVQYGMSSEKPPVEIAQKGITLSQLRPSGIAQFGRERVNVVSRGEFIDENKEIIVESIEGNNIVVKEISGAKSVS
jgi:membrane-bound serine protease (ClpP class)